MSTISTHVLDTSLGRPAAGVAVTLERLVDDGAVVWRAATDADGRVREPASIAAGTYRLRFDVADYFAATARQAFYPHVDITFTVGGGEHYHVPLLLNPFGYATYRGS